MMDRSIPWISLAMRLDKLEGQPEYELPAEYGWRFFRRGEESVWSRIETSSGEFPEEAAGLEGFRRYYGDGEGLDERMIFLTDGGVPFATATAWFGDGEARNEGRLHWVSIDETHQRHRLSYPLVSLALRRLRELGYNSAYLTTQTASWPAIKVYHRFGFRPALREEKEIEGWRIVSEKTGIDFVSKLSK